jgi:hypothetical protein
MTVRKGPSDEQDDEAMMRAIGQVHAASQSWSHSRFASVVRSVIATAQENSLCAALGGH